MTRGQLHVFLGAAPGVGKTYAMLESGKHLLHEGKDVVVAMVETHGRTATAAMCEGLEIVPRVSVQYRGVELTELDLAAVLSRKPDIALVDELAHTNPPGSRHEKRWQDVQELLAAGIDVYSTVNVQHIESLNDVVEQITGIPQQETIPDQVLRDADEIEVIDLTPQALRDRLSEGHIYPAERINAALSNYFRLGNLTALRELALLWLADEVDTALRKYRTEHGIANKWETRERVVVALTGGPEGETLLRRGARIAARSSGGELLAVHVSSQDGLHNNNSTWLAAHRLLVEKLGGTYHQVVGENIPTALVEFARAENATQLVLGASRRGILARALTGPGIGATVIRESGDIDVHIVTHEAAGGRFSLPKTTGALTAKRRISGFLLALTGGPALTGILVALRSADSITSDVLSYQLLVVVVALVGGIWPALFAALLSGLTLDFFFIEPVHTITADKPLHGVALMLYILNAVLVSYVVDQAARRSRSAKRATAESELLATIAGSVLRGDSALQALISRAREAFGLSGVRLAQGEKTLCHDGECNATESVTNIPIAQRANLELYGNDLAASERRLLNVIATQIEVVLENSDLEETAKSIGPLAETDRVRSALLSAVGHDLRRPLAAATAAISGLRSSEISWSDVDRDELLATAEESLNALSALVTSLLDVSRLQAGALSVSVQEVDIENIILRSLDELGLGPQQIELDLDRDLPTVQADPVLLQRVVVNLLENSQRYAPNGTRVRISTSSFASVAQIRVIDHGRGVAKERRDDIFVPFQRLGDTDNSTGLGLGLAISKGFVEGMGGMIEAEDTPGGGLTMVITLDTFQKAAPDMSGHPSGSEESR